MSLTESQNLIRSNNAPDLVHVNEAGLYCPAGDFYIDPWRAVDRALVTHAHSDHARVGSKNYLVAHESASLIRHRLGQDIQLESLPYGQPLKINDATVSFHPAGHVLGSSQIRIEVKGRVWAVSGDFKRDFDPTCALFDPVPCETWITEATFGLPIYRWQSGADTARDVHDWWQINKARERSSLLFCYALGKAQRVLGELLQFTDEPVYIHGALVGLTALYREAGIKMVPTIPVSSVENKAELVGKLILAPPSAYRSPWMKRFKEFETGFASGWMRVRGARRQKGYDRGFVLSDHADWPQLVQTIQDCGAERVLVTHGNSDALVKYSQEVLGLDSQPLGDLYHGDEDASDTDSDVSAEIDTSVETEHAAPLPGEGRGPS